jgi:hypothetical protein
VAPNNSTNYNPTSAVATAMADISESPLPQRRKRQAARDLKGVSTSESYTANTFLNDAAIRALLDCDNKVVRQEKLSPSITL